MADKLTMFTNDRYASGYLIGGKVLVNGFDIEFVKPGPHGPGTIFNDMVRTQPYDISELPLANYIIARDLGISLTAAPVFPTMFFPQLGLMVNRNAGIQGPLDLIGKRVGVSGFSASPAVWLRGILFHHYDLPSEQMIWVEAEPNSMSGVPFHRSRRYSVERTAERLMQQLEAGIIDALILPEGAAPTDKIDRLFSDEFGEVRAHLEATGGVFLTNSVLVIKEATSKANPGLGKALLHAYDVAVRRYGHDAADNDRHMGLRVGELRTLGLFPYSTGLAANRTAIRMMVHYCYEQGLIKTLFEPEELFVSVE
jgi:4,5-dihydroxyphthalate decarboxylase